MEKVEIEAASDVKQVVGARMYLTDISKWEETGKMTPCFFKDIKLAITLSQVSKLIKAELPIEIEVTAIMS